MGVLSKGASCFQSVKVKKFESNSQLKKRVTEKQNGCFQSVKVKKFESNSQPLPMFDPIKNCCFQSVKVKKFESNSQLIWVYSLYHQGWFQSGKDKRNTFIRYFSRVFFPESVFGYVPVFPFRPAPLEKVPLARLLHLNYEPRPVISLAAKVQPHALSLQCERRYLRHSRTFPAP